MHFTLGTNIEDGMIKDLSLKALEKAINHALSLDSESISRIKELEGQSVQIIIKPLNANFYMLFESGQIKLKAQYFKPTDTIIQSSPMGLIRLSFLPSSKVRSLFNDGVKITGNLELGLKLKNIIDHLDLDWEGHLALFTGDVVAHHVGNFVRRTYNWQQQFGQSMQETLREYVHEEARLFPSKEELHDFFNDVDALSLDVARFRAWLKLKKASS